MFSLEPWNPGSYGTRPIVHVYQSKLELFEILLTHFLCSPPFSKHFPKIEISFCFRESSMLFGDRMQNVLFQKVVEAHWSPSALSYKFFLTFFHFQCPSRFSQNSPIFLMIFFLFQGPRIRDGGMQKIMELAP